MKKTGKLLTIAVVGILILAGGFALQMFNAVSHVSWSSSATYKINQLASVVRMYARENGRWPTTVDQAVEWEGTRQSKEYAEFRTYPESYYELRGLTNGFALAAFRKPGILRPEWRVSMDFTNEHVDGIDGRENLPK